MKYKLVSCKKSLKLQAFRQGVSIGKLMIVGITCYLIRNEAYCNIESSDSRQKEKDKKATDLMVITTMMLFILKELLCNLKNKKFKKD